MTRGLTPKVLHIDPRMQRRLVLLLLRSPPKLLLLLWLLFLLMILEQCQQSPLLELAL